MTDLKRGDLIWVPAGRRRGRVVFVDGDFIGYRMPGRSCGPIHKIKRDGLITAQQHQDDRARNRKRRT